MTIVHRLFRALATALLLSLGLALGWAALSAGRWGEVLVVAGDNRGAAAGLAAAAIGVAVLFILSGVRRRSAERYLSFDTEGGTLSVSVSAICDHIAKLAAEFPAVVRLKPQVVPARRGIDIVVDVRMNADSQIHEVCGLLQQRVRESLTKGLGISEVRRVEIRVREIVSPRRPA